MKTISTKNELRNAIENKLFPIKCVGEIGRQLTKKKKAAKKAKIAGLAMIAAGIAAIPFTGGASAAGVASGMGAMGLTATGLTIGGGTVAITTAELAILVGGSAAVLGILKGRKVRLQSDGSVIIE